MQARKTANRTQGCVAVVAYLLPAMRSEVRAYPVLKNFSISPPENSGGAEKSTENSGSHAKNFFCSMYEMSQRHPVWVTENHVKPCNRAYTHKILQFSYSLLGNEPIRGSHFSSFLHILPLKQYNS